MPNGDENTGPQEEFVPPELDEDDLGDGRMPGQVVISVGGGATAGAGPPDFMRQLPVYGDVGEAAEAAPTETGVADLDEALQALDVRGLYRVYGGDPDEGEGVAEAGTEEAFAELASLVLVEFSPEKSIDEAIETLRNVPSVEDASPSGRFSIAFVPDDPDFPNEWGLADIRCPDAWDTTTGAPTVTIAIVDSGCDLSHPDLATQLEPGWNAITSGAQPQDDHGHGTHVSGTIGAIGNNGTQVAGVTWQCRLLPVKVLDATGHSVGASIAQGIAWAATRCWIINCSLQGPVDDLAMRAAILGARSRGVLVVAAMGNFGWTETKPSYPAAYAKDIDNVLAVGAVDQAHRRSVWSATKSSNTGSWIGIAAPGTQILSTALGGGTINMSGTSMASPHVAGVAGLVWSTNDKISAQQVISTLEATATALQDSAADPVPNSSYGYGLLDAKAAVDAVAPAVGDFPTSEDQPGFDDSTRVAAGDVEQPGETEQPDEAEQPA